MQLPWIGCRIHRQRQLLLQEYPLCMRLKRISVKKVLARDLQHHRHIHHNNNANQINNTIKLSNCTPHHNSYTIRCNNNSTAGKRTCHNLLNRLLQALQSKTTLHVNFMLQMPHLQIDTRVTNKRQR